MPVKMTKKDINKLLIEERAKMRTKQKQSAFMRRTLNIYNGQTTRLRELSPIAIVDGNVRSRSLPYTLDELRQVMEHELKGVCCYCKYKLTVKTITPDHAVAVSAQGGWGLDNINFCCQKCNWRKGILTADEFKWLVRILRKGLSAASLEDVWRRLVIGGKWSPR
jgi:5-methylcytosine-specific restriction endonuclease McrA